jgi:hypothetical protein
VGVVWLEVDGSAGCADSPEACGAAAGGRSDRPDLLEGPAPAGSAWRRECLGPCPSLLVEPAALLPGNACAATSAKSAVSATLAAINQRLILLNLRRELSRECVL